MVTKAPKCIELGSRLDSKLLCVKHSSPVCALMIDNGACGVSKRVWIWQCSITLDIAASGS